MKKYALPIISGILAISGVMGLSITGAAVFDRSELCYNSWARACYELDVGPFNLAKLPPQARVNDTFRINPRAGPNKWAACERTNSESVTEIELPTNYCGDNAVEKVKTCNMGDSGVTMYYYTGECRTLDFPICDSRFTIPKDCVATPEDAKLLTNSLYDQLLEMSQNYIMRWAPPGTCQSIGGLQIFSKQEYRWITSMTDKIEMTYWWICDGLCDANCEGNDSNADFKTLGYYPGDIVIYAGITSDALGELGFWRHQLLILGCSEIPYAFLVEKNDQIIVCDASDPYFCGCALTT